MNNNYYRLYEMILGYQGEYQKIQGQLDKLKEYSQLFDLYDCLNFMIKEGRVGYQFSMKKGKLLQGIIKDRDMISMDIKRKDDIYVPAGPLEITDKKMFANTIKQIENSDFCKNIVVEEKNIEDYTGNIKIAFVCDYGEIRFYVENLMKMWERDFLCFCGRNGNITISQKNRLTIDNISNLLNIKIPESALSTYYRDIIESNENGKKEVQVIPSKVYGKQNDFVMKEEENRIILRKIKKKK